MGAPTDKYKEMNEEELFAKILALKQRWGKELCILGHYYQRDEVIRFADFQGDSYALAKAGSETGARYIVFCGVYFMAEASVILAAKDQRVFLPDMDAGCPLADFATIDQVEVAWNHFEKMGIAESGEKHGGSQGNFAQGSICFRSPDLRTRPGLLCRKLGQGDSLARALSCPHTLHARTYRSCKKELSGMPGDRPPGMFSGGCGAFRRQRFHRLSKKICRRCAGWFHRGRRHRDQYGGAARPRKFGQEGRAACEVFVSQYV